MKAVIKMLISQSLNTLVALGELPAGATAIVFRVDYTKAQEYGDFVTNVALLFAKKCKDSPRSIALKIVHHIPFHTSVSRIEVASAGFINFFMDESAKKAVIKTILSEPRPLGSGAVRVIQQDSFNDQIVNIQYAHARISSVLQQMQNKGLQHDVALGLKNLGLLIEPQEVSLIHTLGRYEETSCHLSYDIEPFQIEICLIELAMGLHQYYNAVTLLCEAETLRHARICLLKAVRQILHNGLQLIGVKAPESVSWQNNINGRN